MFVRVSALFAAVVPFCAGLHSSVAENVQDEEKQLANNRDVPMGAISPLSAMMNPMGAFMDPLQNPVIAMNPMMNPMINPHRRGFGGGDEENKIRKAAHKKGKGKRCKPPKKGKHSKHKKHSCCCKKKKKRKRKTTKSARQVKCEVMKKIIKLNKRADALRKEKESMMLAAQRDLGNERAFARAERRLKAAELAAEEQLKISQRLGVTKKKLAEMAILKGMVSKISAAVHTTTSTTMLTVSVAATR